MKKLLIMVLTLTFLFGLVGCSSINLKSGYYYMVGELSGTYILLDKEVGNLVSHTIFRTPSKMGKGILVTPTVDGNLLVGPTSVDILDKDNKETTMSGFEQIMNLSKENIPSLNFRYSITSFCGLRSVGDTGDFIINSNDGFYNVAGIESPGLSSACAIGEYIKDLIVSEYDYKYKDNFNGKRKSLNFFKEASIEEKNEIIHAQIIEADSFDDKILEVLGNEPIVVLS